MSHYSLHSRYDVELRNWLFWLFLALALSLFVIFGCSWPGVDRKRQGPVNPWQDTNALRKADMKYFGLRVWSKHLSRTAPSLLIKSPTRRFDSFLLSWGSRGARVMYLIYVSHDLGMTNWELFAITTNTWIVVPNDSPCAFFRLGDRWGTTNEFGPL